MPQPLGFMMLYDYEGLGGAPALEEITDETFAILGSSNVKIGLKYLPASGNAMHWTVLLPWQVSSISNELPPESFVLVPGRWASG